MVWDEAKLKCEDDNAMLACFLNEEVRDEITRKCDELGYGCWVGYKWTDGM